MRCLVITGTSFKGTTHKLRDIFLENLKADRISQFTLPGDGPDFCLGCKNCFDKGDEFCPHRDKVEPIWEEMKKSDLIVFIFPVYVMGPPGQVKVLLDHLSGHRMAHRPEPILFDKKAAIISQSIGASNRMAQKEVKTSLTRLGISDVRTLSFRLMESDKWEELSPKRREKFENKLKALAEGISSSPRPKKKSLKVKLYFKLCQKMREDQYKKLKENDKLVQNKENLPQDKENLTQNEALLPIDLQYRIDQGRIGS